MSTVHQPGRLTALAALIQTYPHRAEEFLDMGKHELGQWKQRVSGVDDILELWATVLDKAPHLATVVIEAAVPTEQHKTLLYWMLNTPAARTPAIMDLLMDAEARLSDKEQYSSGVYDTAIEVAVVDVLLSGKLEGWHHLLGQQDGRRHTSTRRGRGDVAFLVLDGVLAHGPPLLDGLDAYILRQALAHGADINGGCWYGYDKEAPQQYESLLMAACAIADRMLPNATRGITLLLDFGADWTGMDQGNGAGAITIRQHKRWRAHDRKRSLETLAGRGQDELEIRQL